MFCLWEMCLVISDVCLCVCGGAEVVVVIDERVFLGKGKAAYGQLYTFLYLTCDVEFIWLVMW